MTDTPTDARLRLLGAHDPTCAFVAAVNDRRDDANATDQTPLAACDCWLVTP